MGRPQRSSNLTPGEYRFDKFVYARMYGPNGYYSNGNGVGVDFNTYVNQDTGLAERIGKWLDEQWSNFGRPDPYPVYEIAAGDGTLCRKLLAQDLECKKSVRYTAVESNSLYCQSFPSEVEVIQQFDKPPLFGVIIGNEFLDTQPPRFVSFMDGHWRELFITVADTATYEWRVLDEQLPSTLETIKGMTGSAPWIQMAADVMKNMTQAFTGSVLMIDYGYQTTVEFPGKRWFRSNHKFRNVPFLDLQIQADLSCGIPIDQLGELFYPPSVTSQAVWLDQPSHKHEDFYVLQWRLAKGKLETNE